MGVIRIVADIKAEDVENIQSFSVPDLSIEVDDVDAVYSRARQLGHEITYELTDEPWGVRRFYLNDPTGRTLNVLSHRT